MLNPGLNINKAFRKQLEIILALTFDYKTSVPIRTVLIKESTCVLLLLLYHENRNNHTFKVLSSVVYFMMENYACADYLCC